MILVLLRGAFIVLTAAVITLYVNTEFQESTRLAYGPMAGIIASAVLLAALVIAADVATRDKKLSAISGVFLGLLAGLLSAYALSFVIDLVGVYGAPNDPVLRDAFLNLLRGVKVIIGLITCYLGISLVLQTKDDFRFVIPYVEFAKEIRGNRPTLLDTSVLIDGRVLDLARTGFFQNAMLVHHSVLDELQALADSSNALKRGRGRRGLDILKGLQECDRVQVRIDDSDTPLITGGGGGGGVDSQLIELAARLRARVMTNDFNLNKVATLRGVDVLNLNDMAKALKPVILPGERLDVEPVKPGESDGQGVGFLDDGTMVVIEGGREHLRKEVPVIVTSTIQTSAGRMIFGSVDSDALRRRRRRTRSRRREPSPDDTAIEDHPRQGR